MKGVMRFGNKEKHSRQFVRLYKMMKHVGKVAYELELLNELAPV